jgi:hypothetical protein
MQIYMFYFAADVGQALEEDNGPRQATLTLWARLVGDVGQRGRGGIWYCGTKQRPVSGGKVSPLPDLCRIRELRRVN